MRAPARLVWACCESRVFRLGVARPHRVRPGPVGARARPGGLRVLTPSSCRGLRVLGFCVWCCRWPLAAPSSQGVRGSRCGRLRGRGAVAVFGARSRRSRTRPGQRRGRSLAARDLRLQHTIAKLAERLNVAPPDLAAVLTRWQRHRISSRETEAALTAAQLAPIGRIPSRSALIARATARRVRLTLGEPDSSPAIANVYLAETIVGLTARSAHRDALSASMIRPDVLTRATRPHFASPGRPAGPLQDLAIEDIHPNPDQPRKHFDEVALRSRPIRSASEASCSQ